MFVKLQMGDKYGFLAKFRIPENSSDPGGQKILEYQRMLNPDEFMTFTDIFAAASVTIEMRSILAFDRFPELATEGGALYTYLCSEFSSQKKILTKSKMMVYFEKWLELTNRLIDVLRYQNRITVEVESWDVIGSITYLYPRSNSKVLKFIQKCEKNSYSHRPFFMLHDAAGDKEEYLICYVKTEEDSEQIILSVRNMPEQHILDMGCSINLVMRGSVSAELTQDKAFSDFREGRVCNIALKEIILEDSGLTYHDTDSRIDCFYNKRIGENEKQFEAVHRAFAVEDFFMIQGPPGTGKTTVIKELIMQQLHFDSNLRILIVSQANVAVDNVLRGIKNLCQKEYGISENQIIRCGKEDRIADDIKDFSFEGRLDTYSRRLKTSSCQNPELRGEWIEFIENPDNKEIVGECLLKGFQIIGATCVGFANRNIGLSGFEFDLVIIDEAGKALPGELLIPINHAKKLIIIGDHKQLPPVVNPEMYDTGAVRTKDVIDDEERQDFFNKSFFERLWEKCPESNKCMLDRQFRMPPAVSRLVNLFYDNKLKDGANCKDKYPIAFGNNLVMLDMANEKDYREGKEDNSGPFNLKEADAVVLMITRLREVYSDGIVVITPYKNQKRKLISRIKEKNLWGIRVDTIDAFQGDEENIVIYCMTRSHIKTIFFSDCARLNVAFSRAKNLLIIIGSTKYLRSYGKEHILSRVEELICTHGRVVSFKDFSASNFVITSENHISEVPKEEENFMSPEVFIQKREALFEKPIERLDKQRVCEACGKVLADGEDILCMSCLNESRSYKCLGCGNTFDFPNYLRYIKRLNIPKYCVTCSSTVMLKCASCDSEVETPKYIADEYELKKRKFYCPSCSKFVKVRCECCKNEFEIQTYRINEIKQDNKQKSLYCNDCWKLVTVECCGCHEPFKTFVWKK